MTNEKESRANFRKEKNTLWSTFYSEERDFYTWLTVHAEVLLDIKASSPMYDALGDVAEFGYSIKLTMNNQRSYTPPRFIRKVVTLETSELFCECKSRYENLLKLYNKAIEFSGEKKTRLPQRFPMFYRNVTQLNYSQDDAFSAKVLPQKGIFTLYYGSIDRELAANINRIFGECGFDTLETNFDLSGLSMTITARIDELRQYLNCDKADNVHFRRHTGSQYTCRITHGTDEVRTDRSKFGFIIVHSERRPSFFATPPRKKRNDTLEQKATEAFLPIDLGYRVFISKNEK